MSTFNRTLVAAAATALALMPMTAVGAPSPSPSLNTVLAQPPSGFSELTTAEFPKGAFTAHEYAQASNSAKADQIEKTLNRDGFVDGFGKTWIHNADQHALVEAVIAFTGKNGAKDWLSAAEAGDKTDPTYVHSDTIDGISPSYGGHFAPSTGTVGDVFSFVKGNDVFIVGFISVKDDVLDLARSQAKSQYSTAPNETIPSSQWPENQGKSSSFQAGYIVGGLLPIFVIIGIAAAVFGVVRNRRRGAMTPAIAGTAGTAGAAGVQMSGDGNHWWDGQAWRDAAAEAPPSAQRSADGTLWWDGQRWRPVPGATPPATPEPPPAG